MPVMMSMTTLAGILVLQSSLAFTGPRIRGSDRRHTCRTTRTCERHEPNTLCILSNSGNENNECFSTLDCDGDYATNRGMKDKVISRRLLVNTLTSASALAIPISLCEPAVANAAAKAKGAAEYDLEFYMRNLIQGNNDKEGNIQASAPPPSLPSRSLTSNSSSKFIQSIINDELNGDCIAIRTLSQITNVPVNDISQMTVSFRSKVAKSFATRAQWQQESIVDEYYFDLTAYSLYRTAAVLISDYKLRSQWVNLIGEEIYRHLALTTIDMMGGKPVGMPVVMAERSSDFALDQSDVFLEMLKNSKMTRKQQNEMTDNIRSITYVNTDKETGVKTVRKPFTKAPPVSKLEEFSNYIKSRSGSDRAALIKKMDSKLMKDLGAPDIGHARLALTNPGLLAEDWLSMGGRFVDLDPKRGVFPSKHPSYDTEIARAPDAETYTFGTGVPYTIMLRKLMEKRRLEGKGGQFKPQSPDYKTIEMKPQNVEVVDQQLIDEASKYLEIKRTLGDEEAYKYAQSLIPAT